MMRKITFLAVMILLPVYCINAAQAVCTYTYYYTDGTMTQGSRDTSKTLKSETDDCGNTKNEFNFNTSGSISDQKTYSCQDSVCTQTKYYTKTYNSAGNISEIMFYTCTDAICTHSRRDIREYDETGTILLSDKVFMCNDGTCSQYNEYAYEYNNPDYPDKITSKKYYTCSDGVCTLAEDYQRIYTTSGSLVREIKFVCTDNTCVPNYNEYDSYPTDNYDATGFAADSSICVNGYLLQSGTCVTECSEGYTLDADTGRCIGDEENDLSGASNQSESNNIVSNDSDCPDGKLPYKGGCVDEYPFAKKRYTPAEAAPWLYDENNTVTLIFKK